jgi:tRNA (guanosine-2'-O-)-methyltransferase
VTRDEFERLARHYGATTMVERLRPFVSERRQARIEAVLSARLRGVEVAIENPYDPHNAAAVVRSAEALGIWAVHVIAASSRILRAEATTTGTHNWIDTRQHAGLDEFLAEFSQRRDGMLLAGACVDATHMLDELPIDGPICLLFGNEHAGLSAAAQAACTLRFRIPIFGFAESYNLSVAAALSLYSQTTRRRAALGAVGAAGEAGRPGEGSSPRLGDLDDETAELERARWYLRSIDERHARLLFPLK